MYRITDKCRFCDTCTAICPAGAVKKTYPFYSIDPARCLECGKCLENCSFGAIELVE
ncbi:DUF362 domain-containing protein [Desulfotruncus arcticus]|uniref:DUF362 domain-containing protein n=1 Tax=Desulfotruncus arcticus TaxID=341036 RepID=UPI000B849AE9|nr:4Fe-4S binding protein [Desulfotruncus arcticus]